MYPNDYNDEIDEYLNLQEIQNAIDNYPSPPPHRNLFNPPNYNAELLPRPRKKSSSFEYKFIICSFCSSLS